MSDKLKKKQVSLKKVNLFIIYFLATIQYTSSKKLYNREKLLARNKKFRDFVRKQIKISTDGSIYIFALFWAVFIISINWL